MFAILKHKRNRKFDIFSVRSIFILLNERQKQYFHKWRVTSIFISLMNTKSGIFTRSFATCENTALEFIRWNKNRSFLTPKKVRCPLYIVMLAAVTMECLILFISDYWCLFISDSIEFLFILISIFAFIWRASQEFFSSRERWSLNNSKLLMQSRSELILL